MKRCGKEKTISSLHTMFEEAGMVLMMHNNGLTAAEATDLRRLMRNAGAGFRVIKNRLALRALEGTSYEVLRGFFNGPTARRLRHLTTFHLWHHQSPQACRAL